MFKELSRARRLLLRGLRRKLWVFSNYEKNIGFWIRIDSGSVSDPDPH
jgi:hypothetical protein